MMRRSFPNRRWTALAFAMIVFSGVGGATFGQGPKTAFSFDGVDDRVNCGNGTSLELAGPITVELWVKTTQAGDYKRMVGRNPQGNTSSYEFALHNLRPAVRLVGTTLADWMVADVTIPPGRWTHVAFTYDRSQVRIFINGVPNGIAAVTGDINKNPGKTVYLGDIQGNPSRFAGQMDEVRIWGSARSQDELRAGMCHHLAGTETGLAGYWRADEGVGLFAADQTANHNDGTLVNGTAWVTSGAPVGDASTHVYPGGDLSLSHSDGDTLAVSAVTGSPAGVHIYRVDSAPDVTTPPGGYAELDFMRYWGVFVAGGTSPTYAVAYNYLGHPHISDENRLKLAKRADNAAASWSDSGAILDTSGNTLTAAGQTGTEYILGSSIAQFCNDILLFARKNPGQTDIVLTWTQACDVGNTYAVYRSLDVQEVKRPPEIALVPIPTYTEPLPAGALVFYNILPQSTQFTLSFTGELDP